MIRWGDGTPCTRLTPALFLMFSGPLLGSDRANADVQNVMVPMRDGAELSTELWFPDDAPPSHPALLVRSAYGKRSQDHCGAMAKLA